MWGVGEGGGIEMGGRGRDCLGCIRTETDIIREVKKTSFTGDIPKIFGDQNNSWKKNM